MTNRTKHIINFIRQEVERVHGIDPINPSKFGKVARPPRADFIAVINTIFPSITLSTLSTHLGVTSDIYKWRRRKPGSTVDKIQGAVIEWMNDYDDICHQWRKADNLVTIMMGNMPTVGSYNA